jgi:hypothetical protein
MGQGLEIQVCDVKTLELVIYCIRCPAPSAFTYKAASTLPKYVSIKQYFVSIDGWSQQV